MKFLPHHSCLQKHKIPQKYACHKNETNTDKEMKKTKNKAGNWEGMDELTKTKEGMEK